MKLKIWRTYNNHTLKECAEMCGLEGVNPGSTFLRIEAGIMQPRTEMIEAVRQMTSGAVTVWDMHETRLEWLRQNQAEKLISVVEATT